MFSLIPWREKQSRAVDPHCIQPMRLFQDDFRNIFDRFFDAGPLGFVNDADFPRAWGLDIEDKEQEVVIRAELPGFEVNDINVEIKENFLTIEAKHEETGKDDAQHQRKHVRRSLALPSGLDADKIEAKYHNGVLEIHVPRSPQAVGRRIEIQAK